MRFDTHDDVLMKDVLEGNEGTGPHCSVRAKKYS